MAQRSRLKQLDHFLAQKLYRFADWMNAKTAKIQAYNDRMDEEERLRPIEELGRSLKESQKTSMIFSRCQHLNTRCIHGDEILQVMKVYTLRWWKPELTYRQKCLDCGRPLDREAICYRIREDLHIWHGSWVNRR